MGFAETANLVANLSLKGNFGRQLSTYSRQLDVMDHKLDRTASRANVAGQQIGTGIKNVAKVGVVAAATIGGLTVASLKAAGDFESQLNTINTIARETPEGIRAIGDQIRAMARSTGTPLEELTQGYYDLLSAGIKASDAQNVLTASNKLAIGGLASTAETVDLLTTAINTYGGDATKAAGYADVFAKAVERGKVTAAEIAGSFATVGSIAASSGIEIEELSAGYARLTAAGVPAAEAATQMRSAIVALTRTTKPMEALQKQTGHNYLSIAGKKGLVVAMEQLRKDAKEAGIPLIELLGRVEALNFANLTTGKNLEAYNEDLAAMGDASGTAAEQMAERQKGLNYQLDILRANAKDAGITIGTALLPKITPLVTKLNELVQSHQGDISRFADQFAGLFSDDNLREAGTILTGLFNAAKDAAPALAASAKITGEVVTKAVELFNTLPKELRGLLIAGLAVNKLTGGLVGNIAGGIFGALKTMVVRANVVQVSGSVVQGGGAGGVGGVGGVAGGASKAGRILGGVAGAVTIVGSGLAVLETQQQQSELNTQYSAEIRDKLTTMLGQNPTREQMQTALAGVQQGITDLSSNPLYALVQGDALTNLQQMRALLQAQLDKPGGDAGLAGKKQDDLIQKVATLDASSKANKEAIQDSKRTLAERLAETKRETARGASSTVSALQGGLAATRGAIERNRAIVTTDVKVYVTAGAVSKSVHVSNRHGPSNGSAGGGHGFGSGGAFGGH